MFLISKQSCWGTLAVNFWGLVRGGCLPERKGQVLSREHFGPERSHIFAKHWLHSQVLKSALETKQTFPVHICLLLAKCNFLFERKGAVKLSIAFLDIQSLLKTTDLLSINESNVHNGDLPSPQSVHVLIEKALNKTKTNIFSTVGPWGLFRTFLLLRVWKTDIRMEPSYMCCVREVTSTHLGVELLVIHKVREFNFPQPLKPH